MNKEQATITRRAAENHLKYIQDQLDKGSLPNFGLMLDGAQHVLDEAKRMEIYLELDKVEDRF